MGSKNRKCVEEIITMFGYDRTNQVNTLCSRNAFQSNEQYSNMFPFFMKYEFTKILVFRNKQSFPFYRRD